jgi:predicted DNA-binding transcriptional regulator YafY
MSNSAAVRALRTMDMIPYILEHPGISINQLSTTFNVSKKEIEKDLQLAFMCGLPGYTPYELIDLTYEEGVVTIIDPQVLSKPRNFSSNERVVIVLGLEILRELNLSNSENLKKIENLKAKFLNTNRENSIVVINQNLSFPFFNIINQAIYETRFLIFNYQSISKDILSNRKVLPHNLFLQNGNLYLSGYDFEAQSDRLFKADQILSCEIGDQADLKKLNLAKQEEIVELIISEDNSSFIERNSSIVLDQVIVGGQMHIKIRASNFDWLKRAILSNAPSIKVISPKSLASDVEQMASDLIAAYSVQI